MDEAKKSRTTAKRLFTRSVKDIKKFLEQSVDSDLIESRLAELRRRWNDVQTQN